MGCPIMALRWSSCPLQPSLAAIQATTLLPSRHHLSQSCDIEHLSNLTEERSLKMMIKLIPGGCLFSNYPQLDPRKTGFHYPFLPQLDTRKKQSPCILLGKWLPTTNYRFTKNCSIPIALQHIARWKPCNVMWYPCFDAVWPPGRRKKLSF